MIDKRLFQLNGIIKTLIGLVLMTGLQGLSILAQGIFLARAIVGFWEGQSLSGIGIDIISFAVAFLMRQLLIVLKNQYMSHFADRAVETYRVQLLSKYIEIGPTNNPAMVSKLSLIHI